MQATSNAKDRFHGKTVFITGGGGDFGKNCGIRMAREGANVALVSLNEEKLAEAKAEVEKAATGEAKVTTFVADVTKPDQIDAAIAHVE
jgi:meso-butanediol dehydrogenase/(S,S)-butanediol dehydrogenase/diacetyl reductase